MSNIKAINSSNSTNNLYKLQDNANGFLTNAFPIRRFVKSSFDRSFSLFILFFFNNLY